MHIFAHNGHDHSKELIEAVQNNNLVVIGVGIGAVLIATAVFIIYKLRK